MITDMRRGERNRSHDGLRSLAAYTVLASNVATVIGPTPPGTGVISPARFFAVSKSTSPDRRPFARRLMPMSITVAPRLIQLPGMSLGLAHRYAENISSANGRPT